MKIYELNQNNWGVCGFAAALQAAAANGLVTLAGDNNHDILFPVIKQFCDTNKDMEQELLDFSAVFGVQYGYKNLKEVLDKMKVDTAMTGDGIGLAMTGKGMSRLCKNLGFKAYDFHGTTAVSNAFEFKYANTIYGLGKKGGETGNFRCGLLHWVYCDKDMQLMTWGDFISPDALAIYFDKITHYLPL